jgi:hypothetical protein
MGVVNEKQEGIYSNIGKKWFQRLIFLFIQNNSLV